MWRVGASKEVIDAELAKASAEDLHFADGRILASMCTKPLDMANGDASRVNIVVGVALRRHRQEMRQGYCELASHV